MTLQYMAEATETKVVTTKSTTTSIEKGNAAAKRRLARWGMKILRQFGFLMVSGVFRLPIRVGLKVSKIFKVFNYIFLVYPGSDKDLEGFCPLGITHWFASRPSVGGIITGGKGQARGLYLVVPDTVKEIIGSSKRSQKIIQGLFSINHLIGSRAIALAGQVPGVMARRHQIPFRKPLLEGIHGTVFCVMETLSRVMQEHDLEKEEVKVGLIGVGFVGSALLRGLEEEGYQAFGVDLKKSNRNQPSEPSVFIGPEANQKLTEADIVIALTPRGEDILPYITHFKPGAILLDDTHPKLRLDKIKKSHPIHNHLIYKVAVGKKGVKFVPRLPGYKPDWIPGCAVEAKVAAETGVYNNIPQKEFNRLAKEQGLFAHLVR